MNEAIILALVAVISLSFGGFIWVIKFQNEKMIPSIDKLSEVIEANTDYQKNRDSHRDEMDAELITAVKSIPEQIIKTANKTAATLTETPVSQKVEKQEVKTQVITEVKNGK